MLYIPRFEFDDLDMRWERHFQILVENCIDKMLAEVWTNEVTETVMQGLVWYSENCIHEDYEEADWLWSKLQELKKVLKYNPLAEVHNLNYWRWVTEKNCESIIEQWRPD